MATQTDEFNIACASMAGAAYISNRPKINQLPIPDGWTELIDQHKTYDSSGFEAISCQRDDDIVISFAGTNSDDPNDFWADAGLVSGAGSQQLFDAAAYYMRIRTEYSNAKITFTGHSLGGGLAALMGVFFNQMRNGVGPS